MSEAPTGSKPPIDQAGRLLYLLTAVLFWGMAAFTWYSLDFREKTVVYDRPEFRENIAVGNDHWPDFMMIGLFGFVGSAMFVASFYVRELDPENAVEFLKRHGRFILAQWVLIGLAATLSKRAVGSPSESGVLLVIGIAGVLLSLRWSYSCSASQMTSLGDEKPVVGYLKHLTSSWKSLLNEEQAGDSLPVFLLALWALIFSMFLVSAVTT